MLANVCFSVYTEKKECKRNKRWYEKGCKQCSCSPDGKMVVCGTPANCYKEKKDCEPNKKWEEDGCKKCMCSPDGKAVECATPAQCAESETL